MPGHVSPTSTCEPASNCGFAYQWKDTGAPTEFMFCVSAIIVCLAWLVQLGIQAAKPAKAE